MWLREVFLIAQPYLLDSKEGTTPRDDFLCKALRTRKDVLAGDATRAVGSDEDSPALSYFAFFASIFEV
jgi:hypothetical protein